MCVTILRAAGHIVLIGVDWIAMVGHSPFLFPFFELSLLFSFTSELCMANIACGKSVNQPVDSTLYEVGD